MSKYEWNRFFSVGFTNPPGKHLNSVLKYVGNSISKLQIQVTTYVFELSAGNCHR